MNINTVILLAVTAFTIITLTVFGLRNTAELPIVAIANYGPHSSLDDALQGLKEELKKEGFIEGQTVQYKIADVGFDMALIPQMITKLKSYNPKVMVVTATPIAQFSKGAIHTIPLVYDVITDPVEAGLIKDPHQSIDNITGSSDKQDLKLFLNFAKQLIPKAKTVGLMYSTAESNDVALVNMMHTAASESNLSLIAIPVEQSRDIPMRMQKLKGKADFIYVGGSGGIAPALPVIAEQSRIMGIPVFNVDQGAVKNDLALASFGVDYKSVGKNAGKLVGALLKGENIQSLAPLYPEKADYHGYVSKKKAAELGLQIPTSLQNVDIME